jgi:hypothetical protein
MEPEIFEVFTPVVMKSSIFWDITPCRPLKVNDVSEKHVASTFMDEEKAEQETSLLPEGGGNMFFRNGLHGVISHTTKLSKRDIYLRN